MSKNGCEAMPIDSPSSIHSDAPSARVRMYSEISSSPTTTATITGVDVSSDGLGRGSERAREATEAIRER